MEKDNKRLALKELKSLQEYIEKKTAEEILENSLDITYSKSLIDKKRITGVELLLSFGGPTSWLDLYDNNIVVSYGGTKVKAPIYDEEKTELLWNMVEDLANA